MKKCSKCNQEKSLEEFYPANWCEQGVRPDCKKCNLLESQKYSTNYKLLHPIRRRDTLLKNKYGLPLGAYDLMLKSQNGKCAICKVSRDPGYKKCFSVDHCHKTGKIRGLLCHACNIGLGLFKENIDTFKRVVTYLEEDSE